MRAVLLAIVVAVALCACGASNRHLQPTPPPDLSRLDRSVRTQVESRYRALTSTLADRRASNADLGAAFGAYAMVLHAAEAFDAARPAYLNAQALAPDDARWPYYLGLMYRTESNMRDAAASFERVLRLRPDDVPAMVWLGRTYLELGQAERADATFGRARVLAPREVAAVAGLGQTAVARREYRRAASLFEEAISMNPGVRVLHAPLAQAYRAMGDTARAEAEMAQWRNTEIPLNDPTKEALDTTLDSGLAYQLRGTRALELRDYTGAERLFRQGVAITRADTTLGRSLRHKLGTVLALQSEADAASEQFHAVIDAAPREGQDEPAAKAHYSLGVLASSNGRDADAIDHFRAAVKYDPTYVEAFVALGDALRRSGRDPMALDSYAEAVRLDPRAIQPRLAYALTLARLHRYVDAKNWLSAAVREQPNQPELVNALARIYAAAPDTRARDGHAAFALTQTLAKAPTKTTAFGETMAMTMAELGNYEEAIAIQRDITDAARRAGRGRDARRMEANLRLYEQHRPCRRPWGDEELTP